MTLNRRRMIIRFTIISVAFVIEASGILLHYFAGWGVRPVLLVVGVTTVALGALLMVDAWGRRALAFAILAGATIVVGTAGFAGSLPTVVRGQTPDQSPGPSPDGSSEPSVKPSTSDSPAPAAEASPEASPPPAASAAPPGDPAPIWQSGRLDVRQGESVRLDAPPGSWGRSDGLADGYDLAYLGGEVMIAAYGLAPATSAANSATCAGIRLANAGQERRNALPDNTFCVVTGAGRPARVTVVDLLLTGNNGDRITIDVVVWDIRRR